MRVCGKDIKNLNIKYRLSTKESFLFILMGKIRRKNGKELKYKKKTSQDVSITKSYK